MGCSCKDNKVFKKRKVANPTNNPYTYVRYLSKEKTNCGCKKYKAGDILHTATIDHTIKRK